MRPLHVLDISLPHVAGYTLRARSILASQAALGLEPAAVTGLRHGGAAASCEVIDGIRHHRTARPELLDKADVPVAREGIEMLALARRITEVQREERADVLHAHSPLLCGLPAHAVAARLRLPSVYEVRALWEDAAVELGRGREGAPRYAAIRALETWLARSVDAVVVICEGLRGELAGRGVPDERISVVPNGVEADRFVPAPRDEALAERYGFGGKIVVAYVGTMFRFEGVPLLLEALARLVARRDDVRGLVVGHGETEGEVRRVHAALGLGERVVLTGKIAPADVPRHYALADVLCYPRLPSRITELTTPLKPLEAMAMEKAVLGSDVGGIRELVRDGETGVIFRAGHVEDFERALDRLVSDAPLRRSLGEAARREVVATRNWRTLARRYLDVYAAARERSAARRGLAASFAAR